MIEENDGADIVSNSEAIEKPKSESSDSEIMLKTVPQSTEMAVIAEVSSISEEPTG